MIQFLIIAGLLIITSTALVMFWAVVRRIGEIIFFMAGLAVIMLMWIAGLGYEQVKEIWYDLRGMK